MGFETLLQPFLALALLTAAEPAAPAVTIPAAVNDPHPRCQVGPASGGVGGVGVSASGEAVLEPPTPPARLPITVRLRADAADKAAQLREILDQTDASLAQEPIPEPEAENRMLYRVLDASPETIRRIEDALQTTVFEGFPERVSEESAINQLAAQRANVFAMRGRFDLAGAGVTIALHEIRSPQANHGMFTGRQSGASTPLAKIQSHASTLTAPICAKVDRAKKPELYGICHATHVMGSLAGDAGAESGMAPQAVVHARRVSGVASVETNLAADAADAIDVSNHSYNFKFIAHDLAKHRPGDYDELARFADEAIFDGGPLAIASAGNHRHRYDPADPSPYPCSPSGEFWGVASGVGLGKNALMVGAVRIDLGALAANPEARELANFSNPGPTDDGRIKPELTARGVLVRSSGVALGGAFGQGLWSENGTSMATPIVTGVAALLQELAEKPSAGRGEQLSAVALRAALVNGACAKFRPQNAFGYATCEGANLGPNYEFGYGEVDALASGCAVAGVNGGVASLTLAPGELRVLPFRRPPPAAPTDECEEYDEVSITLAWLDAPGPKLRRDLDMWLIAPDGREILPWRLDPTDPTAPAARAANHIDTLEKITLAAAAVEEGAWRLAILARRSDHPVEVAVERVLRLAIPSRRPVIQAAVAWTGLRGE